MAWKRPRLTIKQVLTWADAHHQRTGRWPTTRSGPVRHAPHEAWNTIDGALRTGCRGLRGDSSLANLLTKYRGVRNYLDQPPLTIRQILSWADAHHKRTGRWPVFKSGSVLRAPRENWSRIDGALRVGLRGFAGGSSLAKLLARHRGVRNNMDRPRLTIKQILTWVDAYHKRTGRWPINRSDPVPRAPHETWRGIDLALRKGGRGLQGGSSLANLLTRYRGVRNRLDQPALTIKQILAWADARHRRTGRWPTKGSGPVSQAPHQTWSAIDASLKRGTRGLDGGSSLARFLAERRGVRNEKDLPPLTVLQILEWADEHAQRTGKWPTQSSGRVYRVPGETWRGIDVALRKGTRGLPPGGSSLSKVLDRFRRFVW